LPDSVSHDDRIGFSLHNLREDVRINDMQTKTTVTWVERAKAIATISFPAIWPFLNFLDINRDENYSLLRLGLYGIVTLLAAVLGFLIFRMVFSKTLSWNRAGAIVAVSIISFFSYSITYSLAHELWQGYYLKSWAAFAVIMFLLAWYLSRAPLFQNLVFVLGAVLIVVPTARYLTYQAQNLMAAEKNTAEHIEVISIKNSERLPGVYHIILDEYGRADVLQKIYGFDNSIFLQQLADRGFYVADKAMSNYWVTAASIPSVLDMSYMYQGVSAPQDNEKARVLYNGGGRVFEFFQKAGYYTALMRYHGADCAPGSPDYCFSRSSIIFGELESNLIRLTPFYSLIDVLFFSDFSLIPKYYELRDVRDFLASLKTQKPVFTHIHMLIPHTPHRFTRTCESINPAQQKTNQDLYKGYIEQVECANIGTLELIDTILDRDSDAIIILQSDHGPKIGVEWQDWRADNTWEQSFSILNAWRIPPGMDCRKELHPELTSVNTFRIVTGCVSRTTPDLLPNRWFNGAPTNKNYVEIFKR